MIEYYNEDCMVGMKRYGDKHFGLCICDPPYGIGMDGGNVGYKGKNNLAKKQWDKATPDAEYFQELFRISENQIIWGGNYFNLPPTRCFLIWDKGAGFKGRTYAECELAWTSFNANARMFMRDPLAMGDYHGKINPCQKPVALYKWLLHNYAKKGDLILDTHVGSASSLIACYDMGFDAVGFELDKDYYEASKKRLNDFMAQGRLFE